MYRGSEPLERFEPLGRRRNEAVEPGVALRQPAAGVYCEGISSQVSGHTTVRNTRSELTQVAALLHGGAAAAEGSCGGLLRDRPSMTGEEF